MAANQISGCLVSALIGPNIYFFRIVNLNSRHRNSYFQKRFGFASEHKKLYF